MASPSETRVTILVSLHHLTEEDTFLEVMDPQGLAGIHHQVTITAPRPLIIIPLDLGGGLNILPVLITAHLLISAARPPSEVGAIIRCGEDLLGSEEVLHTEVTIPMVPHPP